ncbi:hypothetical protein [Fimbriiglobus ruber]|uniref:Transposase n=1 Tax=Fimbriiglobus ruber TaxID=1908690 RepID=A0A225DP57_9BACT|nr:hypothetical protein [Fimbriiglobus ruber]OWK40368.1 hypothetical protein FRUB_05287 [Fimbriiglobus ruber]
MCLSTTPSGPAHPHAPHACPAHTLSPAQRQRIAVQALAGTVPITELADQHDVSRRFVYRQQALADRALADAFDPPVADTAVLFHLPVTPHWIHQLVLGLVLIGHCPLRGVVEICRDLFDYDLSLGTVHNLVRKAVAPARAANARTDLGPVRVGAHDEIFQNGRPVLVGVDTRSTYCYLLSLEDHRDADTWGTRLLELKDRGLAPDAVVADAGRGLRAGLAVALPEVPCRSDVFHAVHAVHAVVQRLENRAYRALDACDRLRHQVARRVRRGQPSDPALDARLARAADDEARAIARADQVALLAQWLRHDVLALAGPSHPDRLALFEFVRTELDARMPAAPDLLGLLVRYLRGQRDDLLAFAAELDDAFAALADPLDLDPGVVRELFAVTGLPDDDRRRWPRETVLRATRGEHYYPLAHAVDGIRRRTVRASSLAENLNSRLRGYFFLRRQLGHEYLALLQFFLNHRRFVRSTRAERAGHSPAEVLTGQPHPHWLELLGFTRFSRT